MHRTVKAKNGNEPQGDDLMNKDAAELIIFSVIWIALMAISCKIGGSFGFTMLTLGTVIMLMFAYYEYRQEQALARERAKVRMFAEKLKEAYKEDKNETI